MGGIIKISREKKYERNPTITEVCSRLNKRGLKLLQMAPNYKLGRKTQIIKICPANFVKKANICKKLDVKVHALYAII